MNQPIEIRQQPEPGKKLLRFRGDTVTFSLTLPRPMKGQAVLRTNLGHAHITRQEIIQTVDESQPNLGLGWFDIPMVVEIPDRFKLQLPLTDVGHFQAKAMFIPEDTEDPVWVPGPNVTINVEPADTCCSNIIYNAFVRQFGPNKNGRLQHPNHDSSIASLDESGYIVIPPSGTFRDLITELDFIIGNLGCRYIQLLPVFPTPTTYGRMGRFGSPYAALSFTAVDPSLADFDSKATPLEQFIELADAVHTRNAKLLLDIAINHTGWAASLHETHPHWLARSSEGKIEVPGAWGVRWEDLTKLDYRHKDLWQYMGNVFLTWCNRGVDGFRCDAGYMIPIPVWEYIIALVREQFPDTLFFLEGLGGKISVTRRLLDSANFNWAYSELFQNYDRRQIESYLSHAFEISTGEGVMAHYAETHDNLRLASRSQTWAKMRTALCALSSVQGTFAFANGVEWFATEKIDVHESPSLNWNAQENQVDHIRRLSDILKNHPAFHDGTEIHVIDHESENILLILRHHLSTGKKLLIMANLDDNQSNRAVWIKREDFPKGETWLDLLTGERIQPMSDNQMHRIDLLPGQVLCLSDDASDLHLILQETGFDIPERIMRQRIRAKALEVFRFFNGFVDLGEWDIEAAAHRLQTDPTEFCRKENIAGSESHTIKWIWPRDTRRKVMLPPDHFLLVESPHPFQVTISNIQKVLALENSLPALKNTYWVLLKPFPVPEDHQELNIHLTTYTPDQCKHTDAQLLLLGKNKPGLDTCYTRNHIKRHPLRTLASNERGALCYLPLEWGILPSRYDAVIAANLNADFPEDRRIMFTRCRAWLVYQDYSQAMDGDCLQKFMIDRTHQGTWIFHVPTGRGTHVIVHIQMVLAKQSNSVQMIIKRETANQEQGRLADSEPVEIILRPDIENRSFHENTKAYSGVEHQWPHSLTMRDNGFRFHPDGTHVLDISQPQGAYVHEPEWLYMIHRSEDENRGFDPHGDLFSPGYFKTEVKGGQTIILNATVENASATHNSEFGIRNSQPATRTSQPATRNSIPETRNSIPETRNSIPETRNSIPETRNSIPETRNSIPETRNSIPETRHPQHETRNSQHETRNSIPETRNSIPETRNSIPETRHPQHETRNSQHETRNPQPTLPLDQVLKAALDEFIVRRGSLKTVIAGYPWFLDWGRDAIIVTRGLIEMGETTYARQVLKLFGQFEADGTLPNMLCGSSTTNRETSDAPLWFFIACKELLAKENKQTWLKEKCGDRTVLEILRSTAESYVNGTPNGIQMDPTSALIFSPAHFTWMDTNHPPGTPREGYPIEIQALWYGALNFLSMVDNTDHRWAHLAKTVQGSIDKFFRLSALGYASDCLHAKQGTRPQDAVRDDALRPNQLLAVTLGAIGDVSWCRQIVETCQELLVPGGIRSLADKKLEIPLRIMHHDRLLCDSYYPYQGRYEGDEDTSRKPAYHNGTAWTWLFPSFCEAWAMAFGAESRKTARAWLSSVTHLLNQGCIGQVPEILDGDFPHQQRGCLAQAWGVSEVLRVWLKL